MRNKIITQKKSLPESIIEEHILWGLYKLGIFAFKCPTTGYFHPTLKRFVKHKNPFAISGVSDILCVIEGKFVAIEVKSAKGRPSPDQIKFIDNVNKHGGIAFIARSWDEVKEKLAL